VTFVLIHGGAHGAWCWGPMLRHLEGPALALDLPGRGARPADLETLRVADFAAAVIEDIEAAGVSRAILVGHSMAGITLPRVLEQIPERIAQMVFVACTVPREGQNVLDAIAMPEHLRPRRPELLDEAQARAMFCSDMDEEQARFVLSQLCPEALGPLLEPARLKGLRHPVPRSYVKLLRDQTLSLAQQDEFARNAGPDCSVHELDAGHDAMVSRPRELAALLERIARPV
jgi:pimeloyl-ACP methyl ester carboxylesterase